MSEQDPFRVFVAHEFTDNAEYNRVFEYLESRDKFFYFNQSQPDALEEGSSAEAMQDAVRQQMENAEVLVVPAGMLHASPGLVDFQIKVAQAFKIPMVLIQPFGQTISIPMEALEAAAEVVEWNDRAIVDAIRKAARGEDTAKWDVIEFDMDDFKPDDD